MPSHSNVATHRRNSFLFVFNLAVIAIVALVGVLAVVQQWSANRQYDQEIAELRKAGLPVDNTSMAEWYLAQTSAQASEHWSEILAITSQFDWTHVAVKTQVSAMGYEQFPKMVAPDLPWAQAQEIGHALREFKPVIERIEQLATPGQKAVRMPLEFDGWETTLDPIQNSRNVMRLLELEFAHAIYERDPARALKALDAMEGTAAAFNWNIGWVCSLIQVAFQGYIRDSIVRSVSSNVWDDAQLAELQQRLAKNFEGAVNWNTALAGERGFSLAAIDNLVNSSYELPMLVLASPTIRLAFLQQWKHHERQPNVSLDELRARGVAILPKGLNRDATISWTWMLPSFETFAAALIRQDVQRQGTIIAVTLKRFQIKYKRWPQDLTELVGFEPQLVSDLKVQVDKHHYRERAGHALVWPKLIPSNGDMVYSPESLGDLDQIESALVIEIR